MRDAVRLAVGTLTILPVRAPTDVDRRTAGRAMVLAPLVGLVLGLVAVLVVWALGGGRLPFLPDGGRFSFATGGGPVPRPSPLSPLLGAVVVVVVLAVLTRALHLDGLADTADGLGSHRSGAAALEVMRRGDIGPFGVVTLVLVLLVQVAAVHRLLQSTFGLAAVVDAVVLSRLVLPAVCSRGVPAARSQGLGHTVAGSVPRLGLALSVGLALASAAVVRLLAHAVGATLVHGVLDPSTPSVFPDEGWHALGVAVLPLVVTGLFARHCLRRLGGVTGDVLGACVEVALTTALVVAAL